MSDATTAAVDELDHLPDALLTEWQQLAESAQATPFQAPDFVLPWWRAFGRGTLVLATARRETRLTGLLPMARVGRTLASPANWHTPLTGALVLDADAATALSAGLLRGRPRRVSLAFVDPADPGLASLRELAQARRFRVLERVLTRSPYVDITGDWAAFEGAMSSGTRAELRRRRRHLARAGTVAFEVSDGGRDLDARFAELVRVEGLGWKGEQGTAIGSQPVTLRFYHDVARAAAARGWLRIHRLCVGGRVLAAALTLESDGVLYLLKSGFDPSERKLAPGVLLKQEIMRHAFETGLRRVELLGDESPHKSTWSTASHARLALQAFAPSPAGRAEHLVFARGRPLAKRIVRHTRLRRLAGGRGPRL